MTVLISVAFLPTVLTVTLMLRSVCDVMYCG